MFLQELLPELPGLRIRDVAKTLDHVVVEADATAPAAFCPHCRVASTRVHSRYTRSLTDRPLAGTPLLLRLTVRRFSCRTPDCPRAVFAEPISDVAPSRARTTADLADAHTAIGFAAGGEPGARLARTLDMPTRPDT